MDQRVLRQHKREPKVLADIPTFSPLKKNTLPGQYRRLGRPRAHGSKLLPVSNSHSVFFIWRDGDIFTDRHFYGYLVDCLPGEKYRTLLEFHWHPSHKGFHCVTPCGSDVDYTGRMLTHCQELNLTTRPHLDPAKDDDRLALIEFFCQICGIQIQNRNDDRSGLLWN